MARTTKPKAKKKVETLTHEDASRKNIPTAEYEAVLHEKDKSSIRVAYERRNRDLDPQLVWRGKDEQDWSDLVVHAPPLYIQEKVHPKALVDDLRRKTEQSQSAKQEDGFIGDLFEDFNGLPSEDAKTEFYQHDAHWSNRMILGDSLQVMASLAEREGLRGNVQCIYFDPPYGIKFNSNFQWSTTSRDVKDGKIQHITREPEQVKAFRDTWRDGIHSYLTYLRDRLTVARDLLTNSGSIFVQIGEENVHRVRAVLDEIFGDDCFISQINFKTTGGAGSPTGGTETLASVNNFILWYARKANSVKYRQPYRAKGKMSGGAAAYNKLDFFDVCERRSANKVERTSVPDGARLFRYDNLTSQSSGGPQFFDVEFEGKNIQ
ncbi:MAG: DNA methyltransferase [Candidatus Thiodiazotropha sp.]